MNKARRKELQENLDKLEDIKADIELLRDEEQEYIDNMPESLQQSERAELAEAAVSAMDEAINTIEQATGELDAAME